MRIGLAPAALAAVALAVGAVHAAAAAPGGPTCAPGGSFEGDVGSFLRIPTCRPSFVSADRYRPARFRLVSGSLPPGLSLWGDGASAAQVDGIPRRAGVYTFTIAAVDALGRRAQGTYTARIHPRLVLAGGKLSPAVAGAPYWARVTASGGKPPYTYGAFSLGGVTLDRSTGVLSGTVAAGGGMPGLACPFRLSVTDATGAATSAVYGVAVVDASGRRVRSGSRSVSDGPRFTWVQGISPRRGPLPSRARVAPWSRRAGDDLRGRPPQCHAGELRRRARRVRRRLRPAHHRDPPVRGAHGLDHAQDRRRPVRNAGIYRVFFGGQRRSRATAGPRPPSGSRSGNEEHAPPRPGDLGLVAGAGLSTTAGSAAAALRPPRRPPRAGPAVSSVSPKRARSRAQAPGRRGSGCATPAMPRSSLQPRTWPRNVFASGCAVTSTHPATSVTGSQAISSIPGALVSGARSWPTPSSSPARATTPSSPSSRRSFLSQWPASHSPAPPAATAASVARVCSVRSCASPSSFDAGPLPARVVS